MDYFYSGFRKVKAIYTAINPATLSGAIDVIVVEQPDGEYKSTPFHVRFGKTGVWNPMDKYVDMDVNGVETDLKMKLGDSGVAYFVEATEGPVPDFLIASPISGDGRDSPIQPPQVPDTADVLAGSAKKLEENRRKQSTIQRRGSKDFIEKQNDNTEEQSLQAAHKNSIMVFASSIFSDRRNRSLPDLRCLTENYCDHDTDSYRRTRDDSQTSSKKESQKRLLNHSKSQALGGETSSNEDILRSLLKEKIKRKKSTRTAPINIKVEDSDSEAESSLNSSTVSSPSHSLMDGRDADFIADGAMSDSEIDRHRHDDTHDEKMTDWKWGEMPETKDNTPKDTPVSQPKRWNWYFWRYNTQAKPEEGISLDELENNQSDPAKVEKYLGKTSTVSIDSGTASRSVSSPSSPSPNDETSSHSPTGSHHGQHIEDQTPTQETMNLPGAKTRLRSTGSGAYSSSSNETITTDDMESVEENGISYFRSLRLSSDKLKSLGLRYGANECRFTITTMYQGTTWCACNIYLYKWYEQIVISDVDGTITKSDVLGHVIPAIGGQWAHSGVADLYTRIKNNGYKMVYLSSRAIGQSHITKQYLRSVAQDSKQLPDGPVLLSPSSVLMAFRKEVIERRPEEFKIAALSDLKKLFPVREPFYAGFGNRETDTKSYTAVGISPSRILIVDPTGRVRRSDSIGYVSNYNSMANDTVDYLFPPLSNKNVKVSRGAYPSDVDQLQRSTWYQPLDCSAFTHWKMDSHGEVDNELVAYESRRTAKK